jgi:DNA-binding CsgD family transcriptional regulator
MAAFSTPTQTAARVTGLCLGAADSRLLQRQVLDEIRSRVPFDAYAWVLTDPATAVGSAPLAEVPWLAELPQQIRLKYLTTVNRWTRLAGVPVAGLHEATGGELSQSLVWRDLLTRYAVTDALSVVFADKFGCWAFLELWRTQPAGPFSTADAALLAAVSEPVTAALRRCLSSTFTARNTKPVGRPGPAVLLMSPELEVRAQTADTAAYLEALLPPEGDHAAVPAGAYNVAAQLLAAEAGVDDHPASARVHLGGGVWLTLRAARIGGAGHPTRRDIAVTVQESSPADRVDLFSRAFGLTAREGDLLDLLARGGTTRELAGSMFVSENTVQDHLKSIFAKTGARNRPGLLSRALGS